MERESAPTIEIVSGEYSSMAYDHYFFYILNIDGTDVSKHDKNGMIVDYYVLDRAVSAICYDHTSRCFWAVAQAEKNLILRLDCYMQVVGSIHYQNSDFDGICVGVSHSICDDVLYISYARGIVSVSKQTARGKIVCNTHCFFYEGVAAICPYIVVLSRVNSEQYLTMLDNQGKAIKRDRCSIEGNVNTIVYDPILSKDSGVNKFYIFVSLENKYQIIQSSLDYVGIALCSCIKGISNSCSNYCGCADSKNICTCDVDGGTL